jgi:glutamine---fructose-6-phosphate transaminase (isomerizing)
MVRFSDPRRKPPYHMHDMILAQPAFVKETLGRVRAADAAVLGDPRGLVITGCGTSFHAAMYGAEILQEAYGPEVAVHAVHAYDLLHGTAIPKGATVLGVSHSGSTPTTNRALSFAERKGARTIGLCGLAGSPMEKIADEVLVTGSVHDHSWANTMSYTTQLAAFARLATGVPRSGMQSLSDDLERLPAVLRRTLRIESSIRQLARVIAARSRVTFLGSGLDAITALEAALKIRETCSHPASAYHPEQFLHGPFLSLDRDEAVVALVSRDDGRRLIEILFAVRAAGASISTIGEAGARLRLPRVQRLVRPIVSIVPLQFLAYHVALVKRVNPDVMRSDVPRFSRALRPLFR